MLLLAACSGGPDFGAPLQASSADFDCGSIESAVADVYETEFSLDVAPSTYAAEYVPEAIGPDERWCEFEPSAGSAPRVAVVVATGDDDAPIRVAIKRIATAYFGSGLSAGGLGSTTAASVQGSIEIPGDSPGYYGAAGRRLEDGTLYVVVADAGSEVVYAQLAESLTESIVADVGE